MSMSTRNNVSTTSKISHQNHQRPSRTLTAYPYTTPFSRLGTNYPDTLPHLISLAAHHVLAIETFRAVWSACHCMVHCMEYRSSSKVMIVTEVFLVLRLVVRDKVGHAWQAKPSLYRNIELTGEGRSRTIYYAIFLSMQGIPKLAYLGSQVIHSTSPAWVEIAHRTASHPYSEGDAIGIRSQGFRCSRPLRPWLRQRPCQRRHSSIIPSKQPVQRVHQTSRSGLPRAQLLRPPSNSRV